MTTRHILHCGTTPIPPSLVSCAWKTSTREAILRSINRREIYQSAQIPPLCEALITATLARYQVPLSVTTSRSDIGEMDASVLIYRSVGDHEDSWQQVRSPSDRRRRYVASGFFHIFLSGRGVIQVGNKKVRFKRGDIVLHNPNVIHSVVSETRFCVSAVVTVPLKYTWDQVVARSCAC